MLHFDELRSQAHWFRRFYPLSVVAVLLVSSFTFFFWSAAMSDKENLPNEDLVITNSFPVEESLQQPGTVMTGEKVKRKNLKRKRAFIDKNCGTLDRESIVTRCQEELNELFRYFKDTLVPRFGYEDCGNCSNEALIACLMEGSSLSLPKLAAEIYAQVRMRDGITIQTLLRELPYVGSRIKYGIDNGNLNIAEDESELCLWCWEARELNLVPKSHRGTLKCLRLARKKVHARIVALSATVASITSTDCKENYNVLKETVKLENDMNIGEIRSLVERSMQKKTAHEAGKEIKIKEKEVLKEIEKSKRDAEKEQKRKEQILHKEKARKEKELKQMKEAAEKEERRREKEEAEIRKQHKRQQDETERELKRREKEVAEYKKKVTMQKQASLMEKIFKIKGNESSANLGGKLLSAGSAHKSAAKEGINATAVTSFMDSALSMRHNIVLEDIQKSHLTAWHKLCNLNRSQHWGIRKKPKVEAVKEIKLHGTSVAGPCEKAKVSDKGYALNKGIVGEFVNTDPVDSELEEDFLDDLSGNVDKNITPVIRITKRTMKLLQFDKSNRPAYYGSWSKKSSVIGPRRPLAKDPALDYDVDSDEEWEEEEPGESLTDNEKDEEESEDTKADLDEDSEDSFFVPDGYLSNDEGAEVMEDEVLSSPAGGVPEIETDEFVSLVQLQKHLQSLTEKALRKGQPIIISNLMHEKAELLAAEDLSGISKFEKIFFQVLCMQAYPGGVLVDSYSNKPVEGEEMNPTQCRASASPQTGAVSNPDLPEFVKSIESHSTSINKIIESLHPKFAYLSKTSIRNKVKEIAVFVDNHHWQVKTEVLKKLGLPISPDVVKKSVAGRYSKHKGISTFFSKRCMPPTSDVLPGSSPLSRQKAEAVSKNDEVQL